MALVEVTCPFCEELKEVKKFGEGSTGNPRYRCFSCTKTTFLLDKNSKIELNCEVDELWSL